MLGLDPSTVSPSSVHDNIYVSASGAKPLVGFDEMTYSQWLAMGGDKGTDVVKSAGFTNPAADDYSFAPGSIALAQGIPQVPWSQMGLTCTPTPTPTPIPTAMPASVVGASSSADLPTSSTAPLSAIATMTPDAGSADDIIRITPASLSTPGGSHDNPNSYYDRGKLLIYGGTRQGPDSVTGDGDWGDFILPKDWQYVRGRDFLPGVDKPHFAGPAGEIRVPFATEGGMLGVSVGDRSMAGNVLFARAIAAPEKDFS